MRTGFIIVVLLGFIVYIFGQSPSSVIAQSSDSGLNGSWDLYLQDTETRHAQVELHEIDKYIFGYANFTFGDIVQRVIVTGSPALNGLRLNLVNDEGDALIVLQFMHSSAQSGSECFEGDYSGFLLDGKKINGKGSMCKIHPDWQNCAGSPVITAGFLKALAASSSASRTISPKSGNNTTIPKLIS